MITQASSNTRVQSAATATIGVQGLSDEQRSALAEKLGYRTIGKELPDDVKLTDIIKSLPAEVRCVITPESAHADSSDIYDISSSIFALFTSTPPIVNHHESRTFIYDMC